MHKLLRAVYIGFAAFFYFSTSIISQQRFLENGEATYRGTEIGTFIDTPKRSKIDLAGRWKWSLDNETWNDVLVPSAYDFHGEVTFTRTFDVPPELIGTSAFTLVCYGVNYNAEFYLNGTFIGRHTGGTTSFSILIPDNILQVGKENTIRVIVDDYLNARNTIPLRQQIWGWKTYGGITRDIFILVTPQIWSSDVMIRPELASNLLSATVSISAHIDNVYAEPDRNAPGGTDVLATSKFGVSAEIIDRQTGEVAVKTAILPVQPAYRKTVITDFSFSIQNPKLWSPSAPDLYIAKLTLTKNGEVIDEYDENIGFRRIDKDGSDIVVNGSRTTLKGIVWREDDAQHGCAMTYEAIEKDIASIKSLGVNLVRVANSSPHPYVVNLCDRYGLFLMEDVPVWDAPGEILGKESILEEARTILREMIERDRNHPSVIAWGLADSFDASDPRAEQFVTALHGLAKSLDTRFTYVATSFLTNDRCSRIVDIAGFNFPDDYVQEFSSSLARWKSDHPDQPVIVTRYGKEVEPGNRNGYSDPMSLEAQARYYQVAYKIIQNAGIAGSTAWTFADWRGDRPLLTVDTRDRFVYTMGLLSLDREKRPAFETFKALLNGEKVSALPMGNHAEMSPMFFLIAGMLLLLAVAYIYNSNRRFHENINRSLLRPYNFFADVRDQRFLSPLQTMLLAVFISATVAVITASVLFHFRDSKVLDYVLTHFIIWDSVKTTLSSLVWSPLKCIAALTGIVLVIYLFFILIVFGLQLFTRQRIFFYHAFSITVWSTLPALILVLVGMFLYRVLENQSFVLPVVVFLIIIQLWVILRFLKSVSIIYDIAPGKVYGIGLFVIIAVLGGVVAYYDFTQSTFAYYKFIVTMLQNSQ